MATRGRKMAKVTLLALAKPDDPIYNRPIMIGGRIMTGKAGSMRSNTPNLKNLTTDPEIAGIENEAGILDESAQS